MVQQNVQVVVMGAGYAGLLATVRLAMKTRNQGVKITLINPSDVFVERPRLHQFAANQQVKQRSIHDVLKGTGVQFIQAKATSIEVNRREVIIQTDANHRRLAYDYLLYATGSSIDQESIPGVRQYAYTLNPTGPRSAEALRSVLPELNRQRGQLLVVGGGRQGSKLQRSLPNPIPVCKSHWSHKENWLQSGEEKSNPILFAR